MKKTFVCIALCLAMMCPSAAFSQEQETPGYWTGNANLFLGVKYLEKDNWEPVDRPIEGGLLFDFRPRHWWVNFAFDFLYATDQDKVDIMDLGIGQYSADVESRIIESNLGLRKVWESPEHIRPFIGGGLAIVQGHIESSALGGTAAATDTGFGPWVDAGVYVTLRKNLNLGIDARWSRAKVDLFDREAWAGGWHAGAMVGYHW